MRWQCEFNKEVTSNIIIKDKLGVVTNNNDFYYINIQNGDIIKHLTNYSKYILSEYGVIVFTMTNSSFELLD
ncbi:MAG: hypothetical protein OMM_15064, partial [Candidatus Magnetoglobus multicellularis str. Araruama]